MLPREADASVHLQGRAGNLAGRRFRIARPPPRRASAHSWARRPAPTRPPKTPSVGFHREDHVRAVMFDRLEGADRDAELLPLPGISNRHLQQSRRGAERVQPAVHRKRIAHPGQRPGRQRHPVSRCGSEVESGPRPCEVECRHGHQSGLLDDRCELTVVVFADNQRSRPCPKPSAPGCSEPVRPLGARLMPNSRAPSAAGPACAAPHSPSSQAAIARSASGSELAAYPCASVSTARSTWVPPTSGVNRASSPDSVACLTAAGSTVTGPWSRVSRTRESDHFESARTARNRRVAVVRRSARNPPNAPH